VRDDEDLRRALRSFSDGHVGEPDIEVIRLGRRTSPGRVARDRLLAVAVILTIAIGGFVLVFQMWGGPQRQQPIQPSPPVSETAIPQPSPSALASEFPENAGSGSNPGPVGGVGDTIAGLRLDDVDIDAVSCRGDIECPGVFAFTVTNTTDLAGRWEVRAYMYRGGIATLGNSGFIELSPGETAVAIVEIDISQEPSGGRGGSYSWNWSAENLLTNST
jgi:hypothetical protein